MFSQPPPLNAPGNFGQTPIRHSSNIGNINLGVTFHLSPVGTLSQPQNVHFPYLASMPPPPFGLHPEYSNNLLNEFQGVPYGKPNSAGRRTKGFQNGASEVGSKAPNAQDFTICIGSQTI